MAFSRNYTDNSATIMNLNDFSERTLTLSPGYYRIGTTERALILQHSLAASFDFAGVDYATLKQTPLTRDDLLHVGQIFGASDRYGMRMLDVHENEDDEATM